MNKNKELGVKDLTFGFEIEGYFKDDGSLSRLAGEWHTDGSVHIDNPFDEAIQVHNETCEDCDGSGVYLNMEEEESECGNCGGTGVYGDSDYEASEYSSVVYKSYEVMLEDLGKFVAGENYATGDGCGLHLHIALKDKRPELRDKFKGVIANLDFLRKLQRNARDWCSCLHNRLVDNRSNYYNDFTNNNELIHAVEHSDKYRFLNFHPTFNTLEFRFLAPCEHKIKNVKNLVDYLVKYLNASEVIAPVVRLVDTTQHHEPDTNQLDVTIRTITEDEKIRQREYVKEKMDGGYRHDWFLLDNWPAILDGTIKVGDVMKNRRNANTGTLNELDRLNVQNRYQYLTDMFLQTELPPRISIVNHNREPQAGNLSFMDWAAIPNPTSVNALRTEYENMMRGIRAEAGMSSRLYGTIAHTTSSDDTDNDQ